MWNPRILFSLLKIFLRSEGVCSKVFSPFLLLFLHIFWILSLHFPHSSHSFFTPTHYPTPPHTRSKLFIIIIITTLQTADDEKVDKKRHKNLTLHLHQKFLLCFFSCRPIYLSFLHSFVSFFHCCVRTVEDSNLEFLSIGSGGEKSEWVSEWSGKKKFDTTLSLYPLSIQPKGHVTKNPQKLSREKLN